MKFLRPLILILLLLMVIPLSAQITYSTSNKKAIKYFDRAMENYQLKLYSECEKNLRSAIEEDGQFIEAHMLLGQVYEDAGRDSAALMEYLEVVEIDADFFPAIYFNIAEIQFDMGQYSEADPNYAKYLSSDNPNPKLVPKVKFRRQCCSFAVWALAHPVPFKPENLGDSINSSDSEYSPSLTVDEQILVITVMRPRDEYSINGSEFEEDFYMSTRGADSLWRKARRLGAPLNSHGNEGAQSIAPDGKTIVFTACDRSDGMGSCDLYISSKNGNTWTQPKNMGIRVNSRAWDSQPSISPDGRTIYFASARGGGKGNMDIWMTNLGEDGNWGAPVNLGDSVNSGQGDMSPFIHPDGKTLYFTSNGHPGMGGFDIFVSTRSDDGTWSKPRNLGYPINTLNDEGFLIVNAAGNKAFFSSDKLGGFGKMDMYSFDLYEEARPTPVTYMKGTVYDAKTMKRLRAKFELIDLETRKIVVESKSDPQTGEFLVSLPTNRNYALNVSLDGYLFYSANFEIMGEYSNIKPFVKDVLLQPIDTGQVVILQNIFFDFDKSDLKPESQVELQKLTDLLVKNPGMKIEIGGHTDNKGTAEYNRKLSESRAKSVYDYLVAKGIKSDRLSYKGYGLTKPVDTNDTEEGRARNRRTEFKVMGY